MAWLSTELYYYPGSAPCRAVLMTIRALKIDVEEKQVDLLKAENKRPWFVRLNRQHTVPTINDKGCIMSESRAIMMYLCNKFCTDDNQTLYPLEPELRGKVDKMLFFDMGTLHYAIREYFKPKLFQGLGPDAEKENLMKQSLDYVDGFLEECESPYLCGDDITIADLSILATITELDALDYNYKCYGDLTRYINRLKENVINYKQCCEKGIELTRTRVKQLEEEVKKQVEKDLRKKSKLCFKK